MESESHEKQQSSKHRHIASWFVPPCNYHNHQVYHLGGEENGYSYIAMFIGYIGGDHKALSWHEDVSEGALWLGSCRWRWTSHYIGGSKTTTRGIIFTFYLLSFSSFSSISFSPSSSMAKNCWDLHGQHGVGPKGVPRPNPHARSTPGHLCIWSATVT